MNGSTYGILLTSEEATILESLCRQAAERCMAAGEHSLWELTNRLAIRIGEVVKVAQKHEAVGVEWMRGVPS